MMVPRDAFIERVVVPSGPDVADDWIAERATPRDVVVTADIPLADRCVKRGAAVLAPNGKGFTAATIGLALATRDLMDQLRGSGEVTGGPKPLRPARPLRVPAARSTAPSTASNAGCRRGGDGLVPGRPGASLRPWSTQPPLP